METLPSIQQSLTQFLGLLGNLSKGQIEGLCQFVNAKTVPCLLSPQWLAPWVNELSPERIDKLIEKAGAAYQLNDVTQHPENIEASPEEKEEAMFVQLYHLWMLHKLLNELNDLQLMRWFEAIPVSPQIQQLQLLQEIHQLMAQLNVDTIMSLHQELQTNEEEPLNNLLQLEPKDFYLYKPLRMLFTLPLDELLDLKRVMPQWDFLQLLHLTKLAQLGLQETTNIRILLSPKIDDPRNRPMAEERIPLTLEIVEQPPGKCVYKRNVKPPPSVMVNGDQRFNDGNIYVVPILLRCDTLEELPKLIKGDTPVKITSSNTIIFKRLKILSTSHQLNEALFSLRFDLRSYNPNNPSEYETIYTVTTTPICVLSHSSQLKATSKNLPIVLEVLPFCGPPSGNTRVAILGNNFIDSPTTRVKFDNTEVMPFFHGTKTLICHVPRHSPGPVIVRVCNDYNRWSETAGTFTYLVEPTHEQQTENIPVPTLPNFSASLNNSGGLTNLINQTLGNDTFYGDLLNISSLDTQSYSSMQYQMVNN